MLGIDTDWSKISSVVPAFSYELKLSMVFLSVHVDACAKDIKCRIARILRRRLMYRDQYSGLYLASQAIFRIANICSYSKSTTSSIYLGGTL